MGWLMDQSCALSIRGCFIPGMEWHGWEVCSGRFARGGGGVRGFNPHCLRMTSSLVTENIGLGVGFCNMGSYW